MNKETYEALKNVVMSNRMLLGGKYGQRKRLTQSEVFEKATALRDITQVENWIDEVAKEYEEGNHKGRIN